MKKFLGLMTVGVLTIGMAVGCSTGEPQEGFEEDVPVNGEAPIEDSTDMGGTEDTTGTEGETTDDVTGIEDGTSTEGSVDGTEDSSDSSEGL
jgi:hypothetical protein